MSANVTATFIGLVVALFGPVLLAVADARFIPPQSPLFLQMLAMGMYVAIVGSVLFIIFHYEHQSLLSIGVRPFCWQTIVWGLVLAAFFMYVFAPVTYWALARFDLGGFEHGLSKITALPIWYLSIGVIFGGIAEELLYRGYAVERIAALTGSYWIAGMVSVAIFGLAHVPTWGWGPALSTVVSGAIATVFYIWQRDLVAIVIAHVITDLSGIVIVPLLARMKV